MGCDRYSRLLDALWQARPNGHVTGGELDPGEVTA